jgi:tRNA(Ile)-lysidine synthase
MNLQQLLTDANPTAPLGAGAGAGAGVAVAASGGVDSAALLHAASQALPGRVWAIHVNHGLQVAAKDFEAQVIDQCSALAVALLVLRCRVDVAAGQSTEEAARRVRYAALAGGRAFIVRAIELLADPDAGHVEEVQKAIKKWQPPSTSIDFIAINNVVIDFEFFGLQHVSAGSLAPQLVALAQHADDQLETVLLALSRGAGVAGLAGMPARFERHGVQFCRPWLSASRAQIEAYAQEQALTWITDPTNADEHFTRNRIRAQVVPALLAAFPQARATFARSASHAAQAAELLNELAQQDLQTAGNPPAIKALQALSPARQANVLRHWLRQHGHTQASTAQLQELVAQIECATTRGHRIQIKVGAGFVVRTGDLLNFEN